MHEIQNKARKLQKELDRIELELLESPQGYLLQKGKCFVQRVGRIDKGITKDTTKIKMLCRKKYLEERKKEILEIQNLTIKEMSTFRKSLPSQLVKKFPPTYQNMPIDYFYHPKIEEWRKKDLKKTVYHPKQVITNRTREKNIARNQR